MIRTKRSTNGLLFTFFPIIIAFIVTYGSLNDSESMTDGGPILQEINFVAPVDMSKAKIAARFGNRPHPGTGKTVLHSGLDLASRKDAVVVAASAGTVVTATFDKARGNYVVIRHDEMYTTSYSHLNSIAIKPGQFVQSGGLIGYVGSTGLSTEPHLHFEVLKAGKAVDPADYLPKK